MAGHGLKLGEVLVALALGPLALVAASCSKAGTPTGGGGLGGDSGLGCTIPENLIVDGGVGRGGIPALTNPPFVGTNDPDASYLRPDDRVISLLVDGEAYAVPHNILWWHEVVNLDLGETQVVVSYCPLTGSSLAFDRSELGGTSFGVSGLLFRNNLILFDAATESLWPQMARGARCGPQTGTDLTMLPSREVRWSRWKGLHPEGSVLSGVTGFQASRDYTQYPYGDYEKLNNGRLLFPESQGEIDRRRPPKERVLGIPTGGTTGVAFPFRALDDLGEVAAVERDVEGQRVAVFWDREAWSAAAFEARADGRDLTFEVVDGRITDVETGSTWRFDGRAASGTMEGARLEPVRDAYVAFWFAWAGFHKATLLWRPDA